MRRAPLAPAWMVPEWPVPARVRALSTLRGGGASVAPYASLNLGGHVGDEAAAVARNRAALRLEAGLPGEPRWLSQVHGTRVVDLDAAGGGAPAVVQEGDAAVTRSPGRVCAILTADCLPVLLASSSGAAVAAVHAGWRGLAAGVIEAAVAALGVPGPQLYAWLGPAIGPAAFEIGAEVREALLAGDPGGERAFGVNARGRFTADLFTLARRRLRRAGVERVFGGGECTHAQPGRFFSHRRDGVTGRQATLVWIAPAGAVLG